METKIVIGCVSCGEPAPKGFNMVAQCEECHKMVWINQEVVEKKNESECPIWCIICLKQAKAKGDRVSGVTWDELVKLKKLRDSSDLGEIKLQFNPEWFKPEGVDNDIDDDLEQEYFDYAKEANADMLLNLDGKLPAMCTAFMSKLKIFDSSLDLSVGCAMASFVERMILDRRERLGRDHLFDGYTHEQKVTIMSFIFGVREAVKNWRKEHPEIKKEEDLGRQLELDPEDTKTWMDGLKYWSENLPKCFEKRDS